MKYHLECQSTSDGSMLIRMYEYDSQLALKNGELENGVLNVNFPNSAVIYLRKSKITSDIMQININTPGGSVSYHIPILKAVAYDVDTIFRKGLLFLLPFYIFTYENQLKEFDESVEKLQKLKEVYIDISNRLEDLCLVGRIDEYTKVTICEMTEKVVNHLAEKYRNVRKEVTGIMGGNVLDHEAKRIYKRGKLEEACANALELFRNGASFEMVEKSIKCLSHEELVELNNQAKEERQQKENAI